MITRIILALLAALTLTACAASSDKAVRQAIQEHPEIVLDALSQHKPELFAMNRYSDHLMKTAARICV